MRRRIWLVAAVLCAVLPVAAVTSDVARADLDGPISDGELWQLPAVVYGVSGDGRYALASGKRVELATGSTVPLPTALSGPRLSADGASVFGISTQPFVAADTDGSLPDLYRLDVDSGAWTLLSADLAGLSLASSSVIGISTDHRVIAIRSATANGPWPSRGVGSLWRVDVATQTFTRVDEPGPELSTVSAAMSGDGRWLAYVQGPTDRSYGETEGHAYLYDVASGTRRLLDVNAEGQAAAGRATAVTLSADGSTAGFVSIAPDVAVTDGSQPGSGRAFVADLAGGTVRRLPFAGAWSFVLSADGARALYTIEDPTISRFRQVAAFDRRDGAAPVWEIVSEYQGERAGGHAEALAISDDGRRIVLNARGPLIDPTTPSTTSLSYGRALQAVADPPPADPPPALPDPVISDGEPVRVYSTGFVQATPSNRNLAVGLGLIGFLDRATGSLIEPDFRNRLGFSGSRLTPDGSGLLLVTNESAAPADADDGDGDDPDLYRYRFATDTWTLETAGIPPAGPTDYDRNASWGFSVRDVSADGRYLGLHGISATMADQGAFRYDVQTNTLVQLDEFVPGPSWQPQADVSISDDGRYAAYRNGQTPGCAGCYHVYAFDAATGARRIVDVRADGEPANRNAAFAQMSAGGRHVLFWSDATDLGTAEPYPVSTRWFVADLEDGSIWPVGPGGAVRSASISGDGQRVAYVGAPTRDAFDQAFVYDHRGGVEPVTELVSATAGSRALEAVAVQLAADGREVLFGARWLELADPPGSSGVMTFARPLLPGSDDPPTPTTSTSTTTTSSTSTTTSTTSTIPSTSSTSTTTMPSTSSTSTSTSTTTSPLDTSSTTTTTAAAPTVPPTSVVVSPGEPDAPAGVEPVEPARLLDTRPDGRTVDGLHQGGGQVAPGQTIRLRVAGRAGVNDSAGAVMLNLTATAADAPGYVTVWPCGDLPTASNLNVVDGDVANLVTAAVTSDGDLCIRPSSRLHLIADVAGAMPSTAFRATAPARLLDSRPGAPTVDGGGALGRVIGDGETFELPVVGRGVSSDTRAVALNVTATGSAGDGYVTVWPCGPVPGTSNLNVRAGQTVAAFVLTGVSERGTVCLRAGDTSMHLLADLQGSLGADAGLRPVAPARLLDTRGAARPAAGDTVRLDVAGRGPVPADATVVMLNVTAVGASGNGYVTVWSCGDPPNASTLNVHGAGAVPNAAVVALDPAGDVCLQVTGTDSDLLVDVMAVQ